MINESEDFAMIVHWRKKHFNSLFNRLFLKVQDEIIPFAELQVCFMLNCPWKSYQRHKGNCSTFCQNCIIRSQKSQIFLFFNNVSQKWFILGWCLGIWTGESCNIWICFDMWTCGGRLVTNPSTEKPLTPRSHFSGKSKRREGKSRFAWWHNQHWIGSSKLQKQCFVFSYQRITCSRFYRMIRRHTFPKRWWQT